MLCLYKVCIKLAASFHDSLVVTYGATQRTSTALLIAGHTADSNNPWGKSCQAPAN